MVRRHRPEVLAPAGSLRSLKTAIDFGADAVYCGGKEFGMRSAPKNLSMDDLKAGAQYAHGHGARVYVTCNVLPRNNEVEDIKTYIAHLAATGIDALIVTDIGVLMAAHSIAPQLELHVSTQAGVTNYLAANALYELGARRVVLARELDLQAIRDIRANIPEDMDIETFVHGSMCMAFSGRCLISNYMNGRDANHGECSQPCRWKYSVVERKRPGQFFPVEENDEGTFLFNSQDMCMLEHVDDMIDAGASSLKIEGRAKSAYYVASITNAYKCAVDEYMVQRGFEGRDGRRLKPFHDMVRRSDVVKVTRAVGQLESAGSIGFHGVEAAGAEAAAKTTVTASVPALVGRDATALQGGDGPKHVELPQWLKDEPYKVSHRDYSTGFYYPEHKAGQNTDRGGYFRDWLVVGEVIGYDEATKRLTLMSRNKIEPGQLVEFLMPGRRPVDYTVAPDGIEDADGNPVEMVNNPAHVFSMPLPFAVPEHAMIRSHALHPTLKAE
ncbi:U32 family peptidase [Bifidobacterium sp. ESL0763]|uniref:peptidase U32 family protein n=1 Tax=Bifidobacterium sp. ESL0763 TaxID=2983227 RepID=UPI0023F8700B|nr:U32 family peptidase [Bifidobacterium sp. ESL0763]MDF7664311.1 U32 family peptidase [Bifidobacterium sp. ESL0763]